MPVEMKSVFGCDGNAQPTAEDQRMEKLYREQIMNEHPAAAEPKAPIVQIDV